MIVIIFSKPGESLIVWEQIFRLNNSGVHMCSVKKNSRAQGKLDNMKGVNKCPEAVTLCHCHFFELNGKQL